MSDPLSITDRDRLIALLESAQCGANRTIDEPAMRDALTSRVRGQDHVVSDVARLIRLEWGKQQRTKPIASLLFLGPTGTGKTELAKALAEHLFQDERNLLRFDCSEFSGPEGKTRLIGSPTGYVGAEQGGQLTRRILNNPRQIILFDEIEKAWAGIFDLFLSMLGDGRLTEQGSGKVADFTQSIVVLTSNAEHEAISRIQEQVSDPHEMRNAVKSHLRDSKIFRPELIARFDAVYVFKPLEPLVKAEVVAIKMKQLAKEYGLELRHVAPELIFEALMKSEKLKDFGVRELVNVVRDMLGGGFIEARNAGARTIRVDLAANGDLEILPA